MYKKFNPNLARQIHKDIPYFTRVATTLIHHGIDPVSLAEYPIFRGKGRLVRNCDDGNSISWVL